MKSKTTVTLMQSVTSHANPGCGNVTPVVPPTSVMNIPSSPTPGSHPRSLTSQWTTRILITLFAVFVAGCVSTAPGAKPASASAAKTSKPSPPPPMPAAPLLTTPAIPVAAAVATAPSSAAVKIQEGDVVRVTFDVSTNLNTIAKVQIDGKISMPLIGDVDAKGKTLSQFQTELTANYSRLLKGDVVTVTMATTASSIYVSGAVLRPGRIPMERPLTVLDAVMEAGGFDHARAKPSGVTVLRVTDGKQVIHKIDMKKVMQGKATQPFYLQPFDTVHVPEKVFNL